MKKPFFWIGAVSALGLALSYFVELGQHRQPCFLCLVQRSLYALLFFTAMAGIFTSFKLWARRACLLVLALNFSVAAYHTLVQLRIVEDRCKIEPSVKDATYYKEMLVDKKRRGCSEISWKIGPLPAPLINAIGSLSLFWLLRRRFD